MKAPWWFLLAIVSAGAAIWLRAGQIKIAYDEVFDATRSFDPRDGLRP